MQLAQVAAAAVAGVVMGQPTDEAAAAVVAVVWFGHTTRRIRFQVVTL